jgi:hypothetical protein
MPRTFRHHVRHAAAVGELGAGITFAAQYFIGMPVGHQPEWLGAVASTAVIPAQYVLFPFAAPLQRLLGPNAGHGTLLESMTPFGPAMRFGMDDLALVALATLIIVGLVDYAAQGVVELCGANKHRLWPILG